jgi:WD40 repeat protein
MRLIALFLLLADFTCAGTMALAQSVKNFPSADAMLRDAKHKELKSGVEVGPGNSITIRQGVGTPTTINVLSFGKDGKLLAAGKDFGRVVVWDVVNRKFLCAADTKQGIISAVAISPDDEVLASGGEGDNFSLKLWHLPDCRPLKRYESFSGFIRSLAFGPNGSWLVVSDNAGTTQILDATAGKQLLTLKETYSPVLSPDGAMLLAVNKTEFNLWNTSDWMKQQTLPRAPTYAIPLAVNPETDSFLVTSTGTFQLVQLSTGKLLPNVPAQALPKFNSAAGGFATFDADAPNLLFGHSEGRLWAWDTKTGQTCVSEVLYSESGTLSTDGSTLAGAKDNSIFAQGQSPDGVLIWDTRRLARECGIRASLLK